MITIEISEKNYEALKKKAKPFEETTPDMVISRMLKTNGIQVLTRSISKKQRKNTSPTFKPDHKIGQGRKIAPAIRAVLSNHGSMTFQQICNHLENDWNKYFFAGQTIDEQRMVKSGERGSIPMWQHKVSKSLYNSGLQGKISEANGRYFITSTGA